MNFIIIPCLVDEIIDNINLVLSDLEQLASSARAFDEVTPLRRYKLLVRSFCCEYARFEDAFGYFTLWLKTHSHPDSKARRRLMDFFYQQIEPAAKISNLCLHNDLEWSGCVTPELNFLSQLDCSRMEARSKTTGQILQWEPHLGPLCKKMRASFHELTANMRTSWNMMLACASENQLAEGKLKPATKRFVPKTLPDRRIRRCR